MPQRGDCQHRYTSDSNRHHYSAAGKGQAAGIYREGSSISAIGRALAAPPETVYSWIKKAAQAQATLARVREAPAVARPAAVVSQGEAWDHPGCRKGARRLEPGIWTTVAAEAGGGLDGKGLVFSVPFGIPACAGRTVGDVGKDGGGRREGW